MERDRSQFECAADCQHEVCRGRDNHHLYWPRRAYKGGIQRKFRNLGENVVEMCRNEHLELHQTTQPPKKPRISEIWEAIHASEG